MELLIMGPPGAGKGTQAKLLCERFGIAHLATGDILREEVRAESELGAKAKSFMDRGDLVPDALINEMMTEHIGRNLGRGFLLDGYPRTLAQAEVVDGYLEEKRVALEAVLNVQVPDDELVDRIVNRVSCPECGAVFNRKTCPPRTEGRCDRCGEALRGRSDDTEETVRNRLQVYRGSTQPVVEHYRNQGKYFEVDGRGAIAEVQEALLEHLRAAGATRASG